MCSEFLRIILVLPHSNAGEERVFSKVRKNKITFRSSLSMEGTLSSILTFKLADVNAVKFKLPSELLKKAKGATWEYNKQHKRKKSRGGDSYKEQTGMLIGNCEFNP